MRLSRLSREERGLIASNARSGPIPLPLGDLEPVPGGWIPADGFGACPYTGLVKGGADGQFD